MTKAETKRTSATTARGRGSYAPQACSICRGKKTKCDGAKPVCGPCSSSGRQDECSWGRESGRKPRTEAHFEAMRKRANALEEYVNLLESVLEKCRREHGGVSDNGQSYLQFRPKDAEGPILPDETDLDYEYEDINGDDVNFTQELCIPTQSLKLEEGNLLLHGNTAIFRFAPQAPTESMGSRFPGLAENPRARYVLLVNGQNDDGYNPDFDWSRYLPTSVPLDRIEHDKLLDLVFKFFTSWCLRIVPDLFLRDMRLALSVSRAQSPPKTTHYSPMLHNALIAVATAFSDNPRIRDLKSRQCFASTAKGYIEAECQQPNISVVHALSVLGSYHSGLGEQTLGYLYFGMSARISQALGLSIDCSAWVQSGLISEHDMLDRNWAHWTTFTQDVCWSLYVGRDFCVPASSDYKRIPIPFVDSEFDEIPWQHPPSGIPPQPNCLSRTFVASCELLMIARRIMDVVNGLNSASIRHEVNDELISSIDLQLNTWKSNLSPELDITLKSRPTATPHRLMMHCTYWWFFVLLHRPFYHRKQRPIHSSDREIDHVKLCKRAAENIVELLGTWRSLYTLRYSPITLVQTAFSAGTIYLLVAVQAASGLRVAQESLKQSLSQAQLCVQYLFEIGKSWQCATNIAEILRNLLQEQLKPLLDRRAIQQINVAGREVFTPAQSTLGASSSSQLVTTKPGRKRQPSSPSSSRKHSKSGSRSRVRGPSPSPSDPLSGPSGSPTLRQNNNPLSVVMASPPMFPHASPSPPTSESSPPASMGFNNDPWNFSYGPLTQPTPRIHSNPSPPSSHLSSAFPYTPRNTNTQFSTQTSTDTSSGFLAMLGGEPLSNAPFLPSGFSSFDYNAGPQIGDADATMGSLGLGEQTQWNPVAGRNGAPNGNHALVIPDSELAVLEQFWQQHFGQ